MLIACLFFTAAHLNASPNDWLGAYERGLKDEFAVVHRGEIQDLALAADNSGAVNTLIGSFDVGLDATSSWLPDDVADAVARFVSEHGRQFGIEVRDAATLVTGEISDVDGVIHVAHLYQSRDGFRIDRGEVTATFTPEGLLTSVNGSFVSPPRYERALPGLEQTAEIAASNGLWLGETQQISDWGFSVALNGFGERSEIIIDRKTGRPLVLLTTSSETIRVDAETGDVVSIRSNNDEVQRDCMVNHPDFPRNGANQATSIVSQSGVQSSWTACEGVASGGGCNYQFKFEESGTLHPLARLDDADTLSEMQQSASCTTGNPVFVAGNGHEVNQMNGWYAIMASRKFTRKNVWNQVSPDITANVDVHVDSWLANGPGAYFNGTNTDIQVSSALSGQTDVFLHEYGHYVVWTFNDVGNECEDGVDESDAIDETFGNIFGELTAAEDITNINPAYSALSLFGQGQGPSAHTTTAVQWVQNCPAPSALDYSSRIHNLGRPMEVAVWELLWNVNCNGPDTCTSSMADGNTIWPGETQDSVRIHVGSAMGYAFKVTGSVVHFRGLALQMQEKIRQDSGSTIKTNARNVFLHHGFF